MTGNADTHKSKNTLQQAISPKPKIRKAREQTYKRLASRNQSLGQRVVTNVNSSAQSNPQQTVTITFPVNDNVMRSDDAKQNQVKRSSLAGKAGTIAKSVLLNLGVPIATRTLMSTLGVPAPIASVAGSALNWLAPGTNTQAQTNDMVPVNIEPDAGSYSQPYGLIPAILASAGILGGMKHTRGSGKGKVVPAKKKTKRGSGFTKRRRPVRLASTKVPSVKTRSAPVSLKIRKVLNQSISQKRTIGKAQAVPINRLKPDRVHNKKKIAVRARSGKSFTAKTRERTNKVFTNRSVAPKIYDHSANPNIIVLPGLVHNIANAKQHDLGSHMDISKPLDGYISNANTNVTVPNNVTETDNTNTLRLPPPPPPPPLPQSFTESIRVTKPVKSLSELEGSERFYDAEESNLNAKLLSEITKGVKLRKVENANKAQTPIMNPMDSIISSISKGVQLKKVEHVPRPITFEEPALLQEIKRGVTLKKVTLDNIDRPVGNDLVHALKDRMASIRTTAFEPNDDPLSDWNS